MKEQVENYQQSLCVSDLSWFNKLHLKFLSIWVTSVGESDIYINNGNSQSLDRINIGTQ
jgi:hypothetical protein